MTIESIQQRNRRVEADKAWETSWTRRLSIAALTYIFLVIYLPFLGLERSWLHATVPVIGYLLSTQTLPLIRQWWLRDFYKGNEGNMT
jgi:hypothetical protein